MSKLLKEFCDLYGLQLVKIRYRHQFGYEKRIGYDIRFQGANLLELEPCEYSNGDKWLVHSGSLNPRRNFWDREGSLLYLKRISKTFLNSLIDPKLDPWPKFSYY